MLTSLYCFITGLFILILITWTWSKLKYIQNLGEVLTYLLLFVCILGVAVCTMGFFMTGP